MNASPNWKRNSAPSSPDPLSTLVPQPSTPLELGPTADSRLIFPPHGKSRHCRHRLRRTHRSHLRGPRLARPTRLAGSAARWPTDHHHRGGELPRLPRRRRWTRPHHAHAGAGRKIRRAFPIRHARRIRPGQESSPDQGRRPVARNGDPHRGQWCRGQMAGSG